MRSRGFTIIELIIVVTIMAILLTLGVVNLRGSQANARDAERKTDVETIAQHLETYYTSGTDTSTSSLCTGGTTTHDGFFTVHTFTASGTLVCTGTINNVSVLVVGGGGGGGQSFGGGGGAGGFRTGTLVLSTNSYPVTVGNGGAIGANGTSSVFSTLTSDGGGRGGNFFAYNSADAGQSGASGGGGVSIFPSGATAGGAGIAGQGNAGGNGINWISGAYSSGGGGGAGGAGEMGSRASAGSGGSGLSSNYSGTTTYYAGGGAGGHIYESGIAIAEGIGGLGGGGQLYAGGSTNRGGGGGAGAPGGSGIVVIRYATPTTSNTYPSTALTSSLPNMTAMLRDIDTESLLGPGSGVGSEDPMKSFTSATCTGPCVQTTAGVTPQPYTTNIDGQYNYIYQPLHTDGTLCNDNLECTKFNLFYRTEVDSIVNMVTSVDQ